MKTLPYYPTPNNDEAIKALIRRYDPKVTAEGEPARLYAMCGTFCSNDLEFIDWLFWTQAFPFTILSCGNLIYAFTSSETWKAYMFLTECDVNPDFCKGVSK